MTKNKKGGVGPKLKGQRFTRRKDASFGNHSGGYNSPPAPEGFTRTHGYTLADEARNTASNRRGAFGRDAKLRYKPVTFISAGHMDPLKDLNLQLATTDEARKGSVSTKECPGADVIATAVDAHTSKSHAAFSYSYKESSNNQQLSNGVRPSSEYSDIRSDHGYDSSDEVILFKGRDRTRNPQSTSNVDSFKLHELGLQLQAVKEGIHENTTYPEDTIKRASLKADDFISLSSKSKRRSRRPNRDQRTSSNVATTTIADYMSNVKTWEGGNNNEDDGYSEMRSHCFSVLRDLGGTDSDAVPDQAPSKDGVDYTSEEEIDAESRNRHSQAEDERMACLLAKQEEIGLGGDDVLLFDGEAFDDERPTPIEATVPRRKRKGDSKSAKILHKKSQYPSATQMADAFDDLDLMDWHRPSLKNFEKGIPALDVSDSEFEAALKTTWQRDRQKKAEKKKTREELRLQGLLSKNNNHGDLRVKYPGGMSLDDLANELEVFLLGSQEQLILPPFDKGTRRTIHLVANKLHIKSQSAGKGRNRYPVLYRSKITPPFDQDIFNGTFAQIKQTWFPRVDADEKLVNESRLLKRSEARNGKSRFRCSLTYRDGDVVGQHATELGADNRGRAMLEKMGWSKGMALGTGENKGIMVPITHVVKKTKAGLGDT